MASLSTIPTGATPYKSGGMMHFGSVKPNTMARDSSNPSGFDPSRFYSVGRNPNDSLLQKIETLKAYFGAPDDYKVESFLNRKRNQTWESEKEDYPQAFAYLFGNNGGGADSSGGGRGMTRNEFLANVLLEKVKASESWQLTRMAPLKAWDGSLEVSWEMINFHQHLLDRLPEEAAPRFSNKSSASGSATLVRYGMALMLESTFAETEVGRETFALNIEQIREATRETFSSQAVVGCITHDPWENIWESRYQGSVQRSQAQLDELMNDEVDYFCRINKEGYQGYNAIIARLRQTLQTRNNGADGDFTLVGQGMGLALEGSLGSKFYLTGAAGARRIAAQFKDGSQPSVVESRAFGAVDHTSGFDPMFHHVTIGGFATMTDQHLRSLSKDEAYYTHMLDYIGYEERNDEYFTFCYKNMYQYAGVWDFGKRGAPLVYGLGDGFMKDLRCYTYGQAGIKYATQWNRIIDTLHQMSPEKQQEAADTLMLLPKTVPAGKLDLFRAIERNEPVFNVDHFDQMLRGGSIEYEKGYTVTKHREFQAKRDRGEYGGSLDSSMADYEHAVRENTKRLRGDTEPRTNRQLWDDNESDGKYHASDADPNYAADRYSAPMLVEDEQGNATRMVMDKTHRTYVRVNRPGPKPGQAGWGGGLEQKAEDAVDILNELFGRIKKGYNFGAEAQQVKWAEHISANASASAADLAKAVEILKHADQSPFLLQLAIEADRIVTELPGATDDHRRILATAFVGVVERYALAAGGLVSLIQQLSPATAGAEQGRHGIMDELRVVQIGHLAQIQSRMALNQLAETLRQGAQLTPLELHNLGGTQVRTDLRNAADIKVGWLDPMMGARQETGALSLFIDQDNNVPLDHDALAITLCANNKVLFDLSETNTSEDLIKTWNTDIGEEIGEGASRGRTSNLLWCILFSLAFKGYIYAAGDGHALDPSVKKRLQQGRDNLKGAPFLPIQSHLADVNRPNIHGGAPTTNHKLIQKAIDATNAIIETGRFKNPAPLAASSSAAAAARSLYDVAKPVAKEHFLRTPTDKITSLIQGSSEQSNKIQPKPASAVKPSIVLESTAGLASVSWKVRSNIVEALMRASLASGAFHRWCVDNDVPLIFGVIHFRPFKTYNTSAILRMIGGPDGAAATYYQKPNMMMANNAVQKTLYGHFSIYSGCVIEKPQAITIAHNTWCNKYLGGNGTAMWNPLDESHKAALARYNCDVADIFVWLLPMKFEHHRALKYRSITGCMPDSFGVNPTVQAQFRFPGCEAFAAHWGFNHTTKRYAIGCFNRKYDIEQDGVMNTADRRANVVCFQELQLLYNPKTGKHGGDVGTVIFDAGHWGKNVYAGCGQVRKGLKCGFKIPFYAGLMATTLE